MVCQCGAVSRGLWCLLPRAHLRKHERARAIRAPFDVDSARVHEASETNGFDAGGGGGGGGGLAAEQADEFSALE